MSISNISVVYDRSDFLNNSCLVAFCGSIGVGKSTLAHDLADSTGGRVLSFADPLRSMVSQIVDLKYLSSDIVDGVRGKDKEIPWLSGGMTGRKLLQLCGTEFGRDMVDPDIWVKVARRKVEPLVDMGLHVFVDDLRFDNEARMIRSLGGYVVEVERDGYEYESDKHKSEFGVSSMYINGKLIL